jgi:hypothetical protein
MYQAVQQAFLQSPLEEIVRLMHRARTDKPPKEQPGIRVIIYNTQQEILPLLDSASRSSLNPAAAPFIPRNLTVPEQLNDDQEETQEDEPVDVGVESTGAHVVPVHQSSVEEHAAANIIRAAYLRHSLRQRQSRASGSTIEALRTTYFNRCLAEGHDIIWLRLQYRLFYFGPLVHALVAAHVVCKWAADTKKRERSKMTILKHLQLEEHMERHNQSTCFLF